MRCRLTKQPMLRRMMRHKSEPGTPVLRDRRFASLARIGHHDEVELAPRSVAGAYAGSLASLPCARTLRTVTFNRRFVRCLRATRRRTSPSTMCGRLARCGAPCISQCVIAYSSGGIPFVGLTQRSFHPLDQNGSRSGVLAALWSYRWLSFLS